VYSTKSSQVKYVWVSGKLLLDNGELTTLDKETILQMARAWQQKLGTPT
jgi:5-methylthioadenosine/S-adenosylhomocysteine deaminase